ncbi:PREDICTED: patatin-like phospholipase domain-containing protein 5 [Amphimedon queenslandica]|uniref:PNPLA domain-containing protein n=1 Tax=Amphimedon queenslandica TaxID=400682 RepID=A0AAN0ICA5_AMPQE|nr:PREDICTED: patatin-like phospholipase domain-containing protein 5 [Amphimedon queenslandica]|eukprot:XP_003384896.2 PREDICTED: patatin-like phospholipase domain-containing protein 5 [Amphimedon queenslandica]
MSTTRRAISFAGGGFMTIYHVGVLEAIAEEGARKQKLTKKKKKRRGSKAMIKPSSHDHFAGSILSRLGMLYGASGGAFIAVNIACGMSPKIAMEFIVDLHERAVSFGCCWGRFGTFHPRFQLVRRTREFFEKYLPPDAHKKCSGRVGVSMTVLPSMENKIITEFNTRAELIQALICSGFVPLFSGYKIPKFRGKYCCDGGLSSNLPYSTDPSVITVSPFTGECDICPPADNESYYQCYFFGQTMNINTGNMYRGIGSLLLLPWKEMEIIYKQGYTDAVNFLRKESYQKYYL